MKKTKRARALKKVEQVKKENHKLRVKIEERKDYDKLYNELIARREVNRTDDRIIVELQKQRNELQAKVKEYEKVIDGLNERLENIYESSEARNE